MSHDAAVVMMALLAYVSGVATMGIFCLWALVKMANAESQNTPADGVTGAAA